MLGNFYAAIRFWWAVWLGPDGRLLYDRSTGFQINSGVDMHYDFMISWVTFIAQGPLHPLPEEFEQMPTIIAAGMVPVVWQGSGFKPKEMPELAGVNGGLLPLNNGCFYLY